MISYKKELYAIEQSNRLRTRKIYNKNLIDLASNDYLGLTSNKKIFKKAYKRVLKEHSTASKASILVNGYSNIHKKFEDKLCKVNRFESGIVVGSGFLANISLIESMIRKKDILFIDEDYHASGMLASKLVQGRVVTFKHNNYTDLENKIIEHNISEKSRIIIAIEGVYSMYGDIAPKEFNTIANKYNAILIVDEAHSSGTIGKDLLGWFNYWDIEPKANHIKMGTLGKAYGSYGAYILASKEIIKFLENRAKPIIYSTAPSLFDIALGYESLKYIVKYKKKLYNKVQKHKKIVKRLLNLQSDSLIIPIIVNDNIKAIDIQEELILKGFIVGAIRQPTVKKAIIRIIIKLDVKYKKLREVCNLIKKLK